MNRIFYNKFFFFNQILNISVYLRLVNIMDLNILVYLPKNILNILCNYKDKIYFFYVTVYRILLIFCDQNLICCLHEFLYNN